MENYDQLLTRLDISQLKNGYFHVLGKYDYKFYDHSYFSYYLITGSEGNKLLFYPATIHSMSEPSATDLICLLMFMREENLVERHNVRQVIIPIGEKTNFGPIRSYNHMITLILDITGSINVYTTRKYKVNARVVDSLTFSLPFCHQTESIYTILKIFYFVIKFKRYYLGHQSILDNESCCYFSLKTIDWILSSKNKLFQKKLKSKTNSDTGGNTGGNIGGNTNIDTGGNVDSNTSGDNNDDNGDWNLIDIPKPDTWIGTSTNWLTSIEREQIKSNIMKAFLSEETKIIEGCNGTKEIIELE